MSETHQNNSEVLVRYRDVSIWYKKVCIIECANFEVRRGSVFYILGEVASGKTTLIKSIYREVEVNGGEAYVLGFNICKIKFGRIPELRKRLGIIPQHPQLLYDRTIYENFEFVLRATGWSSSKKIKQRIEEVAALCLITEKLRWYPYQISGGEQKRAMVARAILNNPPLILADEPYAFLDEQSTHLINNIFNDLVSKGHTIIIALHRLPAQLLSNYSGIEIKHRKTVPLS